MNAAADPPDDQQPTVTPVRRPRRKSSTRNLLEWVGVIVGAVVIALLIKTFVVQAFQIPSPSMEPTLQDGDRVLVNKLSYRTGDIGRGDVVVFSRPDDLSAGPGDPTELIKRVVGLPGDELQTRDGDLYVNGRLLEEPYLDPDSTTAGLEVPFTVPEDQIFVLGDNRTDSTDSRSFGAIPTDSVLGRAFMIMWPPGRIAWL